MKLFNLLIPVLLLSSNLVKGQDSKIEESNNNEDNIEIKVKKQSYEAHWAGFDVGSVILMNSDFGTDFTNGSWLDAPWWENDIVNSTTISMNLFEYKLPIFKQYLGLTTGFGYRNTNIAFRDNYQLDYDDQDVYANQIDLSSEQEEISEIKQNWLAVHYLTVPLLLEFATKAEGKKSFYFNAGVVGGVRVGSRTTLKGKYDNGDRFTNVRRAKYQLNPFFLDASFRIGYGAFGLFGSYSLYSMFNRGKTVDVHPLRLGVSWNWHFSGSDKDSESNEFEFDSFGEEEEIDL
jgi:hypothetical protein